MRAVDPHFRRRFPPVLQKKSGRATVDRIERSNRVEFRVATYDTEGRRVMRSFPSFDLALSEAHQRLAAIAKGAIVTATRPISPDALSKTERHIENLIKARCIPTFASAAKRCASCGRRPQILDPGELREIRIPGTPLKGA